MLFLAFELGQDRYVLQAKQVIEVLPLVHLKQIPQAPAGVAGLINYHGDIVPVIDLCALALNRPMNRVLSTRLILIRYQPEGGQQTYTLGLIAEKTTSIFQRNPQDFHESGISDKNTRYLGPVAVDHRGIVQWIEVNKLLPLNVLQLLFSKDVS